MEKILFESEIFNKEMKGMLPFKIRVTETITDNSHKVEVIREEYEVKGGNLVLSKQAILNGSTWKD